LVVSDRRSPVRRPHRRLPMYQRLTQPCSRLFMATRIRPVYPTWFDAAFGPMRFRLRAYLASGQPRTLQQTSQQTVVPSHWPAASPQTQIDKIAGWRNYGSALLGASNATITAFGTFPSFTFTAALATNYVNNFVLFNSTGFSKTNGDAASNGRTDQIFSSRQQLIAFRAATLFSSNALQYLTTFGREFNAPSWKPATPTATNPDLLTVRVPGTDPTQIAFTRADGTAAYQTDLLI